MRIKLIVLFLFLVLFSQTTSADFMSEEDKTVALGESLLNSVVIVKTSTHEGTGFYISPYEVITDYHVIKDGSENIENDKGKLCEAKLEYEDSELDLAILKTSCEGKPLKIATSAKVGQTVLMMGNPDGEHFFLSKGIVSSLKRKGFVSYDARTIEGNSGGPIVNLSGEVVGVARWVFKVSEKVSIATDYESLARFIAYANHLRSS
jgi:putative serine protease PepD